MKHSIRFIQVNYSPSGRGISISVLRGMETREYSYSSDKFNSILDACNHGFEIVSNPARITFTRVYPE